MTTKSTQQASSFPFSPSHADHMATKEIYCYAVWLVCFTIARNIERLPCEKHLIITQLTDNTDNAVNKTVCWFWHIPPNTECSLSRHVSAICWYWLRYIHYCFVMSHAHILTLFSCRRYYCWSDCHTVPCLRNPSLHTECGKLESWYSACD